MPSRILCFETQPDTFLGSGGVKEHLTVDTKCPRSVVGTWDSRDTGSSQVIEEEETLKNLNISS